MQVLPLALRQLASLECRQLQPLLRCRAMLSSQSQSVQSAAGSTPSQAPAAATVVGADQAAMEQAASASAASIQAAADFGPPPVPSWMYRAIKQKNNMSTAEYLAHKQKSLIARLSFWEKFYYVAGLIGGTVIIATRLDWDGSKAKLEQIKQQKAAALNAKRLEALPAFLSGEKHFASEDEDIPFEGATPAEIQALVDKYKKQRREEQGALRMPQMLVLDQEDDPFEGMSPEEIDAYLQAKANKS